MAVTAGGTPYVESTDLVANYPATSLSLANKVDTKVDYALPVNAQTGTTYTFVLADGLRLTTASNAASSTYTIPPQSSVVWLDNSVIRLVNYGAGVVTVAGGSGVTVTNAATTLAQFESVALIRTGSDAWTLVPFSGGVSNADFSDAATGTYTDGGFNYKYISYTGSGTLTVTKAGFADVFCLAGGGGGGADDASAGAGGGGYLEISEKYLAVGTMTITVGAGGTRAANVNARATIGNFSRFNDVYAIGGGPSASESGRTDLNGGSGAGGGQVDGVSAFGTGVTGQGSNGGTPGPASGSHTGGGGGGAGGVGGNGVSATAGAGGVGLSNSYTGAAVARGGGGGGGARSGGTAGTATDGGGAGGTTGAGTAGTANTGGGGGGTGVGGSGGGNGGSGLVIVRVKV
jgi:hypothetical protein